MTLQQYERISAPFRAPKRRRALILLNRLTTGGVYVSFAVLCAWLLLRLDARLISLALTCGVPFALLSLYRARVNAPRPYEVWGVPPLLPKNTRGKSFPSRHVFSAFVIAAAVFPILPALAGIILILGLMLMVIRVIGGVHFPKDVIAGALIGVASGAIGGMLCRWIGGMI